MPVSLLALSRGLLNLSGQVLAPADAPPDFAYGCDAALDQQAGILVRLVGLKVHWRNDILQLFTGFYAQGGRLDYSQHLAGVDAAVPGHEVSHYRGQGGVWYDLGAKQFHCHDGR